METNIELLTGISLIVVFFLTVRSYFANKELKLFLIRITSLGATIAFLVVFLNFFVPQPESVAKGTPTGETIYIVLLYISMVLGMAAQYFYFHFEKDKIVRSEFDFGSFIAPFFLSPIVFLPLLAAFQDANIDLSTSVTPRLMAFIVAFENGFFWRFYFDKRREKANQPT